MTFSWAGRLLTRSLAIERMVEMAVARSGHWPRVFKVYCRHENGIVVACAPAAETVSRRTSGVAGNFPSDTSGDESDLPTRVAGARHRRPEPSVILDEHRCGKSKSDPDEVTLEGIN